MWLALSEGFLSERGLMAENLIVKSQRITTKKWRDGWDRTFIKRKGKKDEDRNLHRRRNHSTGSNT